MAAFVYDYFYRPHLFFRFGALALIALSLLLYSAGVGLYSRIMTGEGGFRMSFGRRPVVSECFDSPYVECPVPNYYDNIFFEGIFQKLTPKPRKGGVGGGVKRPNPGLWRVEEKMRKGQPVVFQFFNNLPTLVLPNEGYPCLRNACVFKQGRLSGEADVVVVRVAFLADEMIPPRWHGQLYVFDELESPSHYGNDLNSPESPWRYQFNLTTTYSPESDIFHPYNTLRYERIPADQKPNYLEIAANKTKNAVALISNCVSTSGRERYIAEMKKYIDVDVLGLCGNSTPCVGQRVPCLESVFRPYRFYLAFENSLCDGYMTEKFFKVFAPDLHIVPVVFGRVDLAKYFPPKTFVDVDLFPSPAELSLHLMRLGSNRTAYVEHLAALDEYRGVDCYDHYCTMCNAVTSLRLRPKVYDIYEWLSKQCQT